MAKSKSVWLCQRCAFEAPAFENPCRNCNEWNSLVETIKERPSASARVRAATSASAPAGTSDTRFSFVLISFGIPMRI